MPRRRRMSLTLATRSYERGGTIAQPLKKLGLSRSRWIAAVANNKTRGLFLADQGGGKRRAALGDL